MIVVTEVQIQKYVFGWSGSIYTDNTIYKTLTSVVWIIYLMNIIKNLPQFTSFSNFEDLVLKTQKWSVNGMTSRNQI